MVHWWSQIHFVLLTCLLSHLLWWSCGDPSNHFTAYLFRNCYWVNTTAGDGGICVLSFMLWLLHQIHIFKKSVSPPNITLEWPACVQHFTNIHEHSHSSYTANSSFNARVIQTNRRQRMSRCVSNTDSVSTLYLRRLNILETWSLEQALSRLSAQGKEGWYFKRHQFAPGGLNARAPADR